MSTCTLSDFWRQPKTDNVAELASVLEGCKSMIENMGGDPSLVSWTIDGTSRTYMEIGRVLLDVGPLMPKNGIVETPLATEAVDQVIGYSVHEAGHLVYSQSKAPWETRRGGGRRNVATASGIKGASTALNGSNNLDWDGTYKQLAEIKNILEDYYIDNHVGVEWPVLGEYIARARNHHADKTPESLKVMHEIATYPAVISRQQLKALWVAVALYHDPLPKDSNPQTALAIKRLMEVSYRALATHNGATRAQLTIDAANILWEFGALSQPPPTPPTPPQGPEGTPCPKGEPGEGESGGDGSSPKPDEPDSEGDTGKGDAKGEGEGEGASEPSDDSETESETGNGQPGEADDEDGDEGTEGGADGENDAGTEGESSDDGTPKDSDSPSNEKANDDSDGSDGDGNDSEGSDEGDGGENGEGGSKVSDGRDLEHRIQDILDEGDNPGGANGGGGYSLDGFDDRTREGLAPELAQEIEDALEKNLEVLTDLLDTQPGGFNHSKPRVVAQDAQFDGRLEDTYKDITRKPAKEIGELFRKQRDAADRWLFGQTQGRFDDKRLHKPFVGDPNFRKQRAVVNKPDITVGLLLDVSGSMGSSMRLVYETAAIFSEGLLGQSGINFTAWTYTSTGNGTVLTRVADTALGKLHLKISALGGGTPSGEAIMGASELMARARTKHRLLIHFTDGSTSVEETQRAVAFAEKHGVKVFCISLVDIQLAQQYGSDNYTVIRNVADLPAAVTNMLKQLAK